VGVSYTPEIGRIRTWEFDRILAIWDEWRAATLGIIVFLLCVRSCRPTPKQVNRKSPTWPERAPPCWLQSGKRSQWRWWRGSGGGCVVMKAIIIILSLRLAGEAEVRMRVLKLDISQKKYFPGIDCIGCYY